MIKAILFDFDGTIVDSDRVTFMEFVNLMKQYKYPIPTNKQLLKLRGVPAVDMIKKLLPQLTDEKVKEIYEFKNKNADRFMPKIKLFSQVKKILVQLKASYRLAVVTSRRRRGLDMLLQLHNLKYLFEVTVAKEDVVNHKPHPEGIEKALQQLDINKKEAIYVGDAENDVKTAHNAGLPCVIISPSENYGADFHITNILKLLFLINKINEK